MTSHTLPPLDVVVWNVHSSDPCIKAAERHESMEYVLSYILREENENLFILCQDTIGSTKIKILSAMLDGVTQNDGNTAIYYHSKDYSVDPIPVFNECLTVFGLTAKKGPGKILLASFHGKYNISNKTGAFRELLCVLERKKHDLTFNGVIVGGDFNLPAKKAAMHMPIMDVLLCPEFSDDVYRVLLCKYKMPQDRLEENRIDYIIYWPTNIFNDCGPIRTPFNFYKRTKKQRPFEHPILMCRFMNTRPVEQDNDDVVEQDDGDVLEARFTDLDSDTRRSKFDDGKFQADFFPWTERHKSLFFHNIKKAKQLFRDDGASIMFSYWDSFSWRSWGICETTAQVILNCLPKHELFRARRMLVIKDVSDVCLQQTDRKDLFISRGHKAYSLTGYHNSFLPYFSRDVACVSVYGLFLLEGFAPLYTPGERVCCPECPATGDCMTGQCVCKQNKNFCKGCPTGYTTQSTTRSTGCKNKKPKQNTGE